MEIKDSGERREFDTGAVRDMAEGKGRFDLMPMDDITDIVNEPVLYFIGRFMETGEQGFLISAADEIMDLFPTKHHALLELSKHFENGMKKYGQDNWKKGIEARSYCDSSIRHYCKHKAGFDDEPHAVACLWNIVCCYWTVIHIPELNSFKK